MAYRLAETREDVNEDNVDVSDDPICLYVSSIIGFLFPIIGFSIMCYYGCGDSVNGPKQKRAFNVLAASTFSGIIAAAIVIIIWWYSYE